MMDAACSLQAVDLKTFRYYRSLKATGVATSCDKFRQVPTSCDKLRLVETSSDYYRPVGQGTLTGSCDRQSSLGGCWNLPEAASDHHNTFSQGSRAFRRGPGTFRAVSEGPGTVRKQRQRIGNDTKMTKIMKIIQNGLISLEMG